MITFPNCKINLGLHVVERRNDGFHNIETVMYPVAELCDSLEIVPRGDGGLQFTQEGIPSGCGAQSNLVVKAYELMRSEYGVPGAEIYLRKCIPVGAGLGGGSADAAFTVSMVNDLYGLNIDRAGQERLASRLGSDTPFFIRNTPQLCTGRGEVMCPIELSLSGKYIAIVKPPFGISTAEAYGGVKPRKPELPLAGIVSRPVEEWRPLLRNDFEEHLFGLHPRLPQIKQEFYAAGALYASMSGSGSAMFGIFGHRPEIDSRQNGPAGESVYVLRL